MITTFFLSMVYLATFLVTLPVRLFSNATLPTFLSGVGSFFSQYIFPLDGYIPIATILLGLAFFLTFEGSILVWHGINWLMRRFPTQS